MKLKSKHILSMEDLSSQNIFEIIKLAQKFKTQKSPFQSLKGKTVIHLFLEPSTRTQGSFEIAAKRLGATTINISSSQSSIVKGETLIDTAKNLEAMNADLIILRHRSSGSPYILSKILNTPIINAGDGFHEHPTQALLDIMTILEAKGKISGLRVLIVGDIAHSRVARSNIYGLRKLGAKVTLCGPPTLIPSYFSRLCKISFHLPEAIKEADVVMMLRIQLERQDSPYLPSKSEYVKFYQLHSDILKLAKKDLIVMHPGPIHRGMEISTEAADGPHSVILNQVTNGVAVRMALLETTLRGTS
jgi:aspartate carbamoyltransferase catalytic subunit